MKGGDNMKKFILPVILMAIAYFSAPLISSEIDGAGTFFLVAVGLGVGIMLNQFIFKKKTVAVKSDDKN